MELADDILRRVAGGGRFVEAARGEQVVRLRARNARFACKRADHRGDGTAVVDAPAVDGAPDEAERMYIEPRQVETAGNNVELRSRNAGSYVQHPLLIPVMPLPPR